MFIPPRRRRPAAAVAIIVASALGLAAPARACDVCAVYTATEMRESRVGLLVGVAEQYSRFDTLQLDGTEVSNPFGQYLNSSITQLLFGYNVTPRIGLQINLPIIARSWRRLEDGHPSSGSESGFGDMALTGNVLAYHHVGPESVLRLTVLGGIKFPTGNPDRLGEEAGEGDEHGAHDEGRAPVFGAPATQHFGAGDENGVHGHDLALGSGSWDGIVGASAFWSWRRYYLQAYGQYAIRTTGSFDYRYANDLVWGIGPGVYALLTHEYTLGLQTAFTGETKGNDTLDGVKTDDTGLTALYVSPGFTFTWGNALGANLAVDVPVMQHNTALQIVVDWRLRGGVTWRF